MPYWVQIYGLILVQVDLGWHWVSLVHVLTRKMYLLPRTIITNSIYKQKMVSVLNGGNTLVTIFIISLACIFSVKYHDIIIHYDF